MYWVSNIVGFQCMGFPNRLGFQYSGCPIEWVSNILGFKYIGIPILGFQYTGFPIYWVSNIVGSSILGLSKPPAGFSSAPAGLS